VPARVASGGGGLTTNVVSIDRTGACVGGFSVPLLGSGGIVFDIPAGTLWIADRWFVTEWTTTGGLGRQFAFRPPTGQRNLTGVTMVPQRRTFLFTTLAEPILYETDGSGALLSITGLAAHGIADPQGLHFDEPSGTLSVVDGAESRVYLFDVQLCSGTFRAFGSGCLDPTGAELTLDATGCPETGNTIDLVARTGTSNTLPVWFVVGASRTALGSGTTLPLDLTPFGAPGCFVHTSHDVPVGGIGNPGGGAKLQVVLPVENVLRGQTLHWQVFQAAASVQTPLPVVASNGLTVVIG